MHTICAMCINIASKYLALVNFVTIVQNIRSFMGMQGYEHLCLDMEGFFFLQ